MCNKRIKASAKEAAEGNETEGRRPFIERHSASVSKHGK
jgi:hypothetical protein